MERPRNEAEATASGGGEGALRQTVAELRQELRELEQFAYIVSHDLQAPLRSILGFSQLLSRRHKDQLSGEALEFLGYVEHSAQQAQALIQDLLRLSRVGRGERLVQVRPLSDTVRNAIKRLNGRLAAEAVIGYAELPEIGADHVLLAQLLEQLIDNAVKFHRPGEPPQVKIVAQRAGDEWRITVSDNGIGISPDQFENIFMVFRRLHAPETYPGTGIGLAIARKIALLLGGKITVSSDSSGSSFTLQLPAGAVAI